MPKCILSVHDRIKRKQIKLIINVKTEPHTGYLRMNLLVVGLSTCTMKDERPSSL